MDYTNNYNLKIQDEGQIDWDVPLNENFIIIDGQIKARANEIGNINLLNTTDKTSTVNAINSHLIDYVRQPGYAITTGSANAYVVTLDPSPISYVDGMAIYIKINVENTGASTINVNGLGVKSIKDSSGNDIISGGLKVNSIYGLRYEGTSGNFILASKSGVDIIGTATASDLLAGKTATVPSGQIMGTMPKKTGITYIPTTSDQTIPIGYEDGTCKVKGDVNLISANLKKGTTCFNITGKDTVVDTEDATALVSQLLAGVSAYVNGIKLVGSMVNNGAVVITPGTSNIAISKGYHDGNGYVKGDVNKIPSNIVSGITIDGVVGTATASSLGGLRHVSGNGIAIVTVGFRPKLIRANFWYMNTGTYRPAFLDGNGSIIASGNTPNNLVVTVTDTGFTMSWDSGDGWNYPSSSWEVWG